MTAKKFLCDLCETNLVNASGALKFDGVHDLCAECCAKQDRLDLWQREARRSDPDPSAPFHGMRINDVLVRASQQAAASRPRPDPAVSDDDVRARFAQAIAPKE